MWDRGLLSRRPWVWLHARIVGLVNRPPVGYYRVDSEDGKTYRMQPVWANRISEIYANG